ncbi:MAG: LPS assembly protein LptD [Rhodobacteraceae bacterium]|nr:LPS assembly protein LptD [Paracoccaceae bacterium]
MRLAALAILFILVCAAVRAEAERATILADRILYKRGGNELSAIGNVEIFLDGHHLQASQVDFNRGIVSVKGPLTLTDPHGGVSIADYAELDENLRTGVVRGIEMLLNNQLHIAAGTLKTDGERYVMLGNALVTTCRTCGHEEPPIWHFRSRHTVLDRENKRIYLRDAEFVLGDTPLLSFPSLVLPYPGVKRKSGVLPPKLNYSSHRGLTVGLPYFQTLDDHADLTITPFVNNKRWHYLEVETRHRFQQGWIDVTGSLAHDFRGNKGDRGHIQALGGWDLGAGFALSFDGTEVSDATYLDAYDYSEDNTLINSIGVDRRGKETYFAYRTRQVKQLNPIMKKECPSSDSDNMCKKNHPEPVVDVTHLHPRLIHEANWRWRRPVVGIGGIAGLSVDAYWLDRPNSEESRRMASECNPMSICPSPETVQRLTAAADWNRRWNAADTGFVVMTSLSASVDRLRQDPFEGNGDDTKSMPTEKVTRTSATAAVDLSLPLIRRHNGHAQLLEPFVQVAWSPDESERKKEFLNEDSYFVEFDETNLRAAERFAGHDRNETGLRFNVGVKNTSRFSDGHNLELLLGRVFRNDDDQQFTEQSGLAGKRSDYVIAADLQTNSGVSLKQSVVAGDDLEVEKSVSRLSYDSNDFGFDLGYSNLAKDEKEGMNDDSESLLAAVQVGLDNGWQFGSDVNLDLGQKAESHVGLGVEFNRQCLGFSARMERSLRTEATPKEKNSFSIEFSLGSLSGSRVESSETACNGG